MKKWLPWLPVAVFAVWVLSALRPTPGTGFQTREFGRLPVLLNGRIQPMDSVARNSLLQLRTKQSVSLDHGQTLTATEWLVEVMMKPDAADERRVFRIDNLELLGMLKLPENEKYFSFSQLRPQYDEVVKQGNRVLEREEQKLSTSENRSVFEKQLLKLHEALQLYERLIVSLRPPGSDNFTAELDGYRKAIEPGVAAVQASQTGKSFDKEAYDSILRFLATFQEQAKFAYMLAVPPAHPEISHDDWKNIGASLMESAHGGGIQPAVDYYAGMVTAYRQNDPGAFNKAVADYRQWLGAKFIPELNKGSREFFFNDFQAFYKAMVIYVFAFILGIVSVLTVAAIPGFSEWLRRSAFWLICLAFVIHTFGLVFRMALEGRPPVTNLYSSAIFIGWGSVLLGIVLERIYRVGIGILVASLIGFITLVIAHNLALSGDTMEMLRAVLDTNFWLATHVVVVTLGYASTFVAGLLAILYIFLGLFTPLLSQKAGKRESAALIAGGVAVSGVPVSAAGGAIAAPAASRPNDMNIGKALSKMVYGIVCFATLFSFVGTVLGGIWADQSWGRFWGWDPKENGALLIVLWNAIILHARWGGLVRERGIMNLAVFGNIVTSFSWFGVNMLGIGLHSYGFMDAAFKWLMLFIGSQVALILLGCLPLRLWKSFQTPARSPKPGPGTTGRPAPAAS
jgi:cytochrome c-type biogenesis protein CcsB